MTSPVDDEKPEDVAEGEEQKPAEPAKTKKIVWVIWVFFIIFSSYAFVGALMVLFSQHVEPSAVTVPTVSAIDALPEPVTPADVSTENMPYPYEEDIHQEETQEEAPVDLKTPDVATPPVTPAAPEAPVAPAEAVPPQSMIDLNKLPARTNVASGHKPKIAIVIDDMGLNHPNSNRMVNLPAALTLSYLPYAENLPKQAAQAREQGHELLVHMPMEPTDLAHNNPGPNALLKANGTEENLKRFDKNLASFDGYVGINNHMGSEFTRDAAAIRPILAQLKERGLWFLDSKTIGSSVAGSIAKDLGIPSVERDVFLDNVATVAAVNQQLHQLEAVARKKGYAVAIGHPHTATIEALKAWITVAQRDGFELVPLSEIIAERYPAAPIPKYARYQGVNAVEPASGVETVAAKIPQTESLQ